MDSPILFDVPAAATRLGTSERHIRHLISTRTIPFCRVGGKIRFDPSVLDDWLEASRVPVGGLDR